MSSQGKSSKASSSISISGRFYFEDLFLQVEKTLFKVNRRDFEEGSEVFRGMFTLPSGQAVEGCSAERPVMLEGVKAADMESFLAVVYPRPFQGVESMPLDGWKTVFKLSRMWEFEAVRTQAVKTLEEKLEFSDAVDAILTYQELALDSDEVIVPAIRRLITRADDLSEEDAKRLDLTTVMRICTLRGWHFSAGSTSAIDKKIRDAWGISSPSPQQQKPAERPRKRTKVTHGPTLDRGSWGTVWGTELGTVWD